jgi:hypothetical protein
VVQGACIAVRQPVRRARKKEQGRAKNFALQLNKYLKIKFETFIQACRVVIEDRHDAQGPGADLRRHKRGIA